MKLWWKIIIAVFILGLLVVRLGYKAFNKVREREVERQWYVENLRYDFTAIVDTIIMRDGATVGFGTILGEVIEGSYNPRIEDSLNNQLKLFSSLRLNTSNRAGRIRFHFRDAGSYTKGDTFRINSANDQILFFRRPEVFYSIHSVLEGRHRNPGRE